jgi:hypothetical protein
VLKSSARLKVPGGKLLEIKIDYDKYIEKVQIIGDFFVHPEEELGKIENLLIGLDPHSGEAEIAEHVKKFVAANKITLVGITPEAIAWAITNAVDK